MTAMIYCPFPDRESARQSSRVMLEEKLIACANILGEVEALFVWKGECGEAREVGVLFKTDQTLLEAACERLSALHPYDTPAILGWDCQAAPRATRDWLAGINTGEP
ncbi:divalent-cation tolerance protein CutA [Altererythrobacter sp.]|uniref:divalent-cation tolerance protein CutA n=1 Tax=Altererythrobacter sp. TaxID=1872480 RepID=UPI003D074BA8